MSSSIFYNYESPDETAVRQVDAEYDTTQVPRLSPEYLRKSVASPSSAGNTGYNSHSERMFTYVMFGAAGMTAAIGAKNSIINYLATWAPSGATLAAGTIEVDLSAIPEGKNVVLKWRGKPVFIRHRTAEEIEEANAVDVTSLRDPQSDSDRTIKPEWLVMIGVCTHLGCVPVGEAGDFGGWYCPCHGSHYDISGRIRQGPAPLNLEIPPYRFISDSNILIG